MFKMIVNAANMLAEVKRLRFVGRVWRTVLEAFGIYMEGEVIDNFQAQGRPEAWPDVKEATKIARFLRTHRGKNRSKKAMEFFMMFKILMDSGRLRNSIASAVLGNMVQIGTNVIYAAVQNFGWKEKNIPERRFLLFQDRDEDRFADIIEKWLMEGGNGMA